MAIKGTGQRRTIQVNADLKLTQKQHDDLVDYILQRLLFAKQVQDPLRDRFEIIDREVAGYLILEEDDRKRMLDNAKGYGPKVVDVIIPLVIAQMDEAVTYLLSVLAPDDAMYTAIAKKDKQAIAKGFSALMNKHAADFKHYRHLARFLWNSLKYNLGALTVEWEEVQGTKIENSRDGVGIEIKSKVVKTGNCLEAPDMYNLLIDPSVSPVDLSQKGEFFAEIEMETPFRLKKAEAEGEIFNLNFDPSHISALGAEYFREHPEIRTDGITVETSTNWISVLTAAEGKNIGPNVESIEVAIWIPVSMIGTGKTSGYEIWRVKLIKGMISYTIARMDKLNNAHGMLPIGMAMPWDDDFGLQTKSYAELLLPYQRFASYQINVHQRAARKALYGVTLYDKQQAPLMEHADMLAGKIPVNPSSNDRDIRKAVFQFRDVPDTQNTLRDVDAVDSLMQKILPTDMLKQVTDLERATQYQAAATVQGANRRNLKIAKIIYAQALDDTNKMQMYNILQYQQSMEIIDDGGNLLEVNPAEYRDAELEYAVADGLKGLDKLAVVTFYKELLNAALQSEQINANLDLVALLDYMSTLMGDKTDIGQFKFKTEFDKLDPQQKQLAFQLLQQAIAAQESGQGGAGQQQPPVQ